jgi:hypothetical protein
LEKRRDFDDDKHEAKKKCRCIPAPVSNTELSKKPFYGKEM